MSEPPVLETERLILRGWRGEDADAFVAMMSDAHVARFLTMDQKPPDRINAWRAMAMFAGHWTLRGYGFFVIEEKATGAFIGRAGAWMPEGWIGIELGWAIARPYWGRGYAYEAAHAAGSWAFAHLDLPRLISIIHPDNTRSAALAQRLGMAPGAETLHAGMPHTIWSIARGDWRA